MRDVILKAFVARGSLPVSWNCSGVVQAIEHESGNGRSWNVKMQPSNGPAYFLCVSWDTNGNGHIVGK